MSNIQSLIAEVKADLSKYSDAGLLDENSMYRDILLGLKKFGNDIMVMQDIIVDVKNHKAILPDSFYSLKLAALCEPIGYKRKVETHDLQSSLMYRERTEKTKEWSECDNCCETNTDKVIVENIYSNSSKIAEFYYGSPTLLGLAPSFDKNMCAKDCRNKIIKESIFQISITGQTLHTNFKEGKVYMVFNGLPTDEEGEIDIPETRNMTVEEYLEYRLKEKISERLIGNGDAGSGLRELYPTYIQKSRETLRAASNSLKMKRLTPNALYKRIWRANRLETLQYESPFSI